MNKQTQQVADFMSKIGQEILPPKPVIPTLEVRKLRARLILEKVLETIQALGISIGTKEGYQLDLSDLELNGLFEPNLIEIADGLADLHYVAYCGTAIACGIDNMDEIFNEIHRSNMSKLWTLRELYDWTSLFEKLFKDNEGEVSEVTLKKRRGNL